MIDGNTRTGYLAAFTFYM
ncbi:hypothetical protein [Rhizobium mongolense]|nr:hypothetical protein [Rhizobium mongolense]